MKDMKDEMQKVANKLRLDYLMKKAREVGLVDQEKTELALLMQTTDRSDE